jgi:hypothetical protein
MPLAKVEFKAGINKENTNYSNEGGFYNCDKIRFRSGYAEQLGGWTNYSVGNTFYGVPHSLFNWTTYSSENLLAFGTTQKYYVEYNGQYRDITPVRTTAPTSATQFATTSGSKLVTVTVSAHGASPGTWITFTGSLTFNGVTISGTYEIVTTPTGSTFTISTATAASSTGTDSTPLTISFQINAGAATFTVVSAGWGIGPWGNGGWGQSTSAGSLATGLQLKLWTQNNFGQDLIFAPRGGDIYWWTKDTSTFTAAVTLQEYSATITKTTKVATFTSGVTTIVVSDAIGVNRGATVTGIGIPVGAYVTTSYAGGVNVPISAATTAPSSGSYNFSYSGQSVPNQTFQVLTSDIYQFAVAIGSNPYNPDDFSSTFNPMLIRWSDQSNPAEWVPETSNQSGEQVLANGSFLICARSTRQEILVWSDSAMYSMQYIGAPFVFSFQLLMDNISIASPNAAITVNNITYWMGTDKFYQYAGQVQTIPCTVRNYVFQNINDSQQFQIVCGTNPAYNEIWWFYPSSGSFVNDSYVIYNYIENIWYYGTMPRCAWLASSQRTYPMAAFAVESSFLANAITSSATTITLVNALSYPASGTVTIDSEQITYTNNDGYSFTGCTRGANSTTAATHVQYSPVTNITPNQIVYHEFGVDDFTQGAANPLPIFSYIETADFDITDGDRFSFVWRMLPDLTFQGSTAASPSVTLMLNPRVGPGSPYTSPVDEPTVVNTVKAPLPPNVYPVEQFTTQIYTRVRGRQMSFRIECGTLGTTWQMGSMRFDIRADGRRA